jgi:uncharacterized protein (TIGR04255 family)
VNSLSGGFASKLSGVHQSGSSPSFIVGIQTIFEEGRDVLQMQMNTLVSDDPSTYSMVLDLIYFLGQPGAVGFEDVFEWLNAAHSRIEDAFEGCLKDPLRARFGEIVE